MQEENLAARSNVHVVISKEAPRDAAIYVEGVRITGVNGFQIRFDDTGVVHILFDIVPASLDLSGVVDTNNELGSEFLDG